MRFYDHNRRPPSCLLFAQESCPVLVLPVKSGWLLLIMALMCSWMKSVGKGTAEFGNYCVNTLE